MAFRQGSGNIPPAAHMNGDYTRTGDLESNGAASSSSNAASSSRQNEMLGKISALKAARGKKNLRKNNARHYSAGLYLFILLCVVGFTFLGSDYIGRALVGDYGSDPFFDRFPGSHYEMGNSVSGGKGNKRRRDHELHFGQGFQVQYGDRDSRDWDSDDRTRIEGDIDGSFEDEYARLQRELEKNQPNQRNDSLETNEFPQVEKSINGATSKTPGLSYERGRNELKAYEKKYEEELKESNSADPENDSEDLDDEYDPEQEPAVRRAGKSMQTVPEKFEKPPKVRRRSRRGACEINFANLSKVEEPENSSKFAQFNLSYVISEESPPGDDTWTRRFAGHQTMEEREHSFRATNQTIHCGFVRAPDLSQSTGFDLSEKDTEFLATCQVAVLSCIFGNSDRLHPPRKRKVPSSSKEGVCFVLFVDQQSWDVMLQDGHVPDENGFISPWRVVLVSNLPYSDLRRVGKIPKFLSHRLFPSARYSIWVDSKLRLQSDPLLILEYYLWRGNHEYAISNHYDRHCLWDEVQQNKRLNKFNHTLIDEQFMFYQKDGLTRFNASDPKRLLPSNVPEGSFIVRAHTPMSNLFSCLWFNEVDHFTPRDQLSFAYTYMKLVRTNPGTRFRLTMFKDCERKWIVKLYRHRQDTVSVQQ